MPKRQEFPAKVKVAAYERCKGRCEGCTARLVPGKFRYDHRIPDALGGKPTLENCQVACRDCHSRKTHTEDRPIMAKADRQRKSQAGVHTSSRPMAGGRNSPWRKRMNGRVEPRHREAEHD